MPQIPRCDSPSLEEFRNHFAVPELPVILTGLTGDWAACSWTPEAFAGRFPNIEVSVTPRDSLVEGTHSIPLHQYVDSVLQGTDEGDYLTSWCFRKDCPELLEDFTVPQYFRDDWLEELPELNDMMWLFLGAKGSGMSLHQDLGHTAAWNAQVTGLKRWALVAPEFEDYLYDGRVCCFKPNRVRYSKFRHAQIWEGEVRAGEVLFIPGAWWHQTQNLETGFSITANYVDETNYERVLRCLKGAGEEDLFEALSLLSQKRLSLPS